MIQISTRYVKQRGWEMSEGRSKKVIGRTNLARADGVVDRLGRLDDVLKKLLVIKRLKVFRRDGLDEERLEGLSLREPAGELEAFEDDLVRGGKKERVVYMSAESPLNTVVRHTLRSSSCER